MPQRILVLRGVAYPCLCACKIGLWFRDLQASAYIGSKGCGMPSYACLQAAVCGLCWVPMRSGRKGLANNWGGRCRGM